MKKDSSVQALDDTQPVESRKLSIVNTNKAKNTLSDNTGQEKPFIFLKINKIESTIENSSNREQISNRKAKREDVENDEISSFKTNKKLECKTMKMKLKRQRTQLFER